AQRERRCAPKDPPKLATRTERAATSPRARSRPPRPRVAPACCRRAVRAQSTPHGVRGAAEGRARRCEGERRDPYWPERARGLPRAGAGRAIVPLDWVKAFDRSAGPTSLSRRALSSSRYGKYYHRGSPVSLAIPEHFVIR